MVSIIYSGQYYLASSAGLSMGSSLRIGFEKKPIRRVRCLRRRLSIIKPIAILFYSSELRFKF